jgi:hypothetical protein
LLLCVQRRDVLEVLSFVPPGAQKRAVRPSIVVVRRS